MGNLCALHHERFDALYTITNNYNKATLLDKLIYWWQISTYTLDDDKIWFTRSLKEITLLSKIPQRTVERYLAEFEKNGYIEKVNRLLKIKHLYIRITDKLLAHIRLQSSTSLPEQCKKIRKEINPKPKPNNSLFLGQNGGTDHANLTVSIYKEQDYNKINNIIVNEANKEVNVNLFDKKAKNNFQAKSELKSNTPTNLNIFPKSRNNYQPFAIEQQIGTRLSPELCNYIKGMLNNTQKQNEVKFSNPEQIFAEVVFSVLNSSKQLEGINNILHHINIIAKLLRENRWKTPKGFYKYWDVGKFFEKKWLDKEVAYKLQKKSDNTHNIHCISTERAQESIISQNIYSQLKNEHLQQKEKEVNQDEVQKCTLKSNKSFSPIKATSHRVKQNQNFGVNLISQEKKQLQQNYFNLFEIEQNIASELKYLDTMQKYCGHNTPLAIASINLKLERLYIAREKFNQLLPKPVRTTG